MKVPGQEKTRETRREALRPCLCRTPSPDLRRHESLDHQSSTAPTPSISLLRYKLALPLSPEARSARGKDRLQQILDRQALQYDERKQRRFRSTTTAQAQGSWPPLIRLRSPDHDCYR